MRTEFVIPFEFDTGPIEKRLQETGEAEAMRIIDETVRKALDEVMPHKIRYSSYGVCNETGEIDWRKFIGDSVNRWLDEHTDQIVDEAALLLVTKGCRKRKWREVLAEVKGDSDGES